jgi:hypothetical protein
MSKKIILADTLNKVTAGGIIVRKQGGGAK